MKRRLTIKAAVWVVLAAIAMLSLTASAAVQGDKKIRIYDDCEPISFNEAFGEGICTGNGRTTVQEFLAELEETQDAHKWRNVPSEMQINVGRPTLIENRGGEAHTFTPVAAFGGGFLPNLNAISGNPVPAPECLNLGAIVFILAGGTEQGPTAGTSELPVGTNRFQCCIHPWMRTLIEVHETGAPAPAGPAKANASGGHHH